MISVKASPLDVVSHVHGKYIYEIGYHVLPYFLHQLAPAYQNPAKIDVTRWQNRETEGILYVPKAGEMLYRLRSEKEKVGDR